MHMVRLKKEVIIKTKILNPHTHSRTITKEQIMLGKLKKFIIQLKTRSRVIIEW